MKHSFSICLTWIKLWRLKWHVVCPSVLRGFKNEGWMWRSLSVCLAKIPIWRMKCNVVCSCVMLGFQYEGWKEKEFVCWISTWGVEWSIVCPSDCLNRKHEGWNETQFVRLSVLHEFKYEGWKKFVSLSFIPIWGVKWKFGCPSVCLKRQYEEWNEK